MDRQHNQMPLVSGGGCDAVAASICAHGRVAIHRLLEAYECARNLRRSDWDFAVELGVLLELGLTTTDVRWLICKDYVHHGQEIHPVHGEVRSFHKNPTLRLQRTSCFVLTDAGAVFAQTAMSEACNLPKSHSAPFMPNVESPPKYPAIPKWDKDRQELRLNQLIVKRYRVPAPNQALILEVFEEENWPVRIDDPLPQIAALEPKRRLHDTINALNRNQINPVIRFAGDGKGEGVRWQLVSLTKMLRPI